MDIYYLFQSGFTIEHKGDCLILDYFTGKISNNWKTPTPKDPISYNSVTVFASHSHPDHYNPDIFLWEKERADIKYVLSSDIKEKAAAQKRIKNPNISFVTDGESLNVNGYSVTAYGSTDIGVSFHITKDELSIFHAGDLNFWHWSDESSQDEIREAREKFDAELGKIRNGVERIDVAFFPVDPRMKTDYYRGAILFCMEMRPSFLIPMHYGRHFMLPSEFIKEAENFTQIKMPDNSNKSVRIDIK